MCGRYALYAPPAVMQQEFGLPEFPAYRYHYNVGPGSFMPVLTQSLSVTLMQWGFVPHWQRGEAPVYINARKEEVAQKPAFRQAFAQTRCIVFVSGFYVWKAIGLHKQPYFIRRPDDRPFALAGLWGLWGKAEAENRRFLILTQPALGALKSLHERMPVVLHTAPLRATWLEQAGIPEAADLSSMAASLYVYKVDARVNSIRYTHPDCVHTQEMSFPV